MADSSLTILVGMSMHPDANAQLEAIAHVKTLPSDIDDLRTALQTADAIVCYSPVFNPDLLSHAPRLKSIACHACGEPMRAEARKRGIRVTLVPSLWDTVADHTIALIFAAARNVPQAHHAIKTGAWNGSEDLKIRYSGYDVFGKTLGIVGLGRIGSIVAQRMQSFDMCMIYADTVASRN